MPTLQIQKTGTERCSNLPLVTQPVGSRAGIRTRAVWLQGPCSTAWNTRRLLGTVPKAANQCLPTAFQYPAEHLGMRGRL